MMRKTGVALVVLMAALLTSGCAPLLIGGAGAVVADEVVEQDKGGDGLF
jgi:predicted small secreted protein